MSLNKMSDTAKPSAAAGKDNTHEEQGKLKRELNAFDLTVHTKKERQTDGESMLLIACIF